MTYFTVWSAAFSAPITEGRQQLTCDLLEGVKLTHFFRQVITPVHCSEHGPHVTPLPMPESIQHLNEWHVRPDNRAIQEISHLGTPLPSTHISIEIQKTVDFKGDCPQGSAMAAARPPGRTSWWRAPAARRWQAASRPRPSGRGSRLSPLGLCGLGETGISSRSCTLAVRVGAASVSACGGLSCRKP